MFSGSVLAGSTDAGESAPSAGATGIWFVCVSICPASATVTSQPSVLDQATFSVTVEVRSSLVFTPSASLSTVFERSTVIGPPSMVRSEVVFTMDASTMASP